ncbi:hypothetical protein [Chlamydiifrater volucris]|uniref:hypothetical protein n=1 Tax=Chlamydiifrater volucris TaxID=2681470 RepID=UPI001BCA8794|nr:hypothetical protein [Chlamydiifrater volucris]
MFSQISLSYTSHRPFETLETKDKIFRVVALTLDILLFPVVAVISGIVGSLIFILKTVYAIVKELLHRRTCESGCADIPLYNRIWGRVSVEHFVPSFILMVPIIGIALYWIIRKPSVPCPSGVHLVDTGNIFVNLPLRESFAALEEKAPQPCLGESKS